MGRIELEPRSSDGNGSNGRYESFVVRVWVRGRRLVRGQVTHTRSGDVQRFTQLRNVADFISHHVAGGDQGGPQRSGARRDRGGESDR